MYLSLLTSLLVANVFSRVAMSFHCLYIDPASASKKQLVFQICRLKARQRLQRLQGQFWYLTARFVLPPTFQKPQIQGSDLTRLQQCRGFLTQSLHLRSLFYMFTELLCFEKNHQVKKTVMISNLQDGVVRGLAVRDEKGRLRRARGSISSCALPYLSGKQIECGSGKIDNLNAIQMFVQNILEPKPALVDVVPSETVYQVRRLSEEQKSVIKKMSAPSQLDVQEPLHALVQYGMCIFWKCVIKTWNKTWNRNADACMEQWTDDFSKEASRTTAPHALLPTSCLQICLLNWWRSMQQQLETTARSFDLRISKWVCLRMVLKKHCFGYPHFETLPSI